MKAYKQRTKYLNMPVVGLGDRIDPKQELKRYQIIENMLIAGTQGVKCVVFDDGDYRVEKETDNTYMVSCLATGSMPCATGMVNGAYFNAHGQIRWEGLKKGTQNWLYITGGPKTFEDCTAIRTTSVKRDLGSRNSHLLMGYIDLRTDKPVLNIYPDGKVYSDDVARHALDNTNPHGRSMIQDELIIHNNLQLGDEEHTPVISAYTGGEKKEFPIDSVAAAVSSLAGQRVLFVDFETGGDEGILLSVEDGLNILFASPQGSSLSVGNFAVGYEGSDGKVDKSNEVMVYNNGDIGVKCRLMVICG
jgi:hypothetical protein